MTIFFLSALLVTLIVIHMAQSRFDPIRLSAARFFRDLPPASTKERRWKPGNPLRSRPLYIQFPLLALLLIALLSSREVFAGGESQGIGLWLLIDTSASMTTLQEGETRMDKTRREAVQTIAAAQEAAKEYDFCLRLSTFDLERRDLMPDTQDATAVVRILDTLSPRLLGTDLSLVVQALSLLENQTGVICPITHLVVISDFPAPEWVSEERDVQIIWQDLGLETANVGLNNIQATRNPLTGLVDDVRLEIVAFGTPPPETAVQVTGPSGERFLEETFGWEGGNAWRGSFTPEGPGLYEIELSPGGAYPYDDQAIIEIGQAENVVVDWEFSDRNLPESLGWTVSTAQPHLRIAPYGVALDETPTLLVGGGYLSEGVAPSEIGDFYETSPILTDLNFDVVETLGLRGAPLPLPSGFIPVLRGTNDSVWLAQRENPPAAYVPGLPTATSDNLEAFSVTVFFNAVRWLLQTRPLPSLYTLTTPAEPEPEDNRLALHENEGNTAREPYSFGSLEEIQPVIVTGRGEPVWPLWLVAAMLLLFFERGLAAFGGNNWR